MVKNIHSIQAACDHMQKTCGKHPVHAQRSGYIAHRDGDGFSLLELVVAVSIMLILAVVGFVSYQGYTDNARQAAVETVASDVLTAVVASYNVPHQDPMSELAAYNEQSDEIVANITTASAEYLEITAEDNSGTVATVSTSGDFSRLGVTSNSEANVSYGWDGTPHQSASYKMVDGEVVARNIIENPKYWQNGAGWNAREKLADAHGNEIQKPGSFEVVSSAGLFTGDDFGDAVGDRVLKLTRLYPDEAVDSFFLRVDIEKRQNIDGYSHIAYAVPMQGTGKAWMYFRNEHNEGFTGKLDEQDRTTYADGGWVTASGEITEGSHYADLYIGSSFEPTETPTHVDEVYFGSPIVVVGNSQEEVESAVAEYFDGDSQ